MRSFRRHDPPRGGGARGPAAGHVVHFYDEHEALLQSVASFVSGGLLRGAPALIITMPDRAEALKSRLVRMGADVERAIETRQLVMRDSIETIERVLVDEMPDEERFRQTVGGQVASMTELWRPFQLLAFGDMVDVLVARRRTDAAIALERMWNDLAHRVGFALYCAYDARKFNREGDREAFDAIRGEHDDVVTPGPGETPPLPTT